MDSIDVRHKEFIKCWKDKTRKYFIENYLSTFDADERKDVPFKLFPRQYEFLKSLVEKQNTIAVKHRQAGITTVSSAWVTAQLVFANPSSPETVLCIGNKLDISEQLINKIDIFLQQVPRWMWGDDYYSPDPNSPKNTKSIYKKKNKQHLALFNGCNVYARSSGENAARGISAVSILIFDEAAFIQNGPAVYAQAVASTASVSNAKIIMVSTPNGKDQLYYSTYSNALAKKNNYNPVIFKWYQDPRFNRYLIWQKKNTKTGKIDKVAETIIDKKGHINYDEDRWESLVKDGWTPSSPWYRQMCQTFNNDAQKIAQELDVSFSGSSNTVVAADIIEMHRSENVIEINDEWELRDVLIPETWIWQDPHPEHRYICSVDPSSGSGADPTAIEILDIDAIDENGLPTFEQVLEYNGKANGGEIGQIVDRYGRIYNNALIVVECIGGYGDSVVLTLLNLHYPNLYYDNPQLKNYTNQELMLSNAKDLEGTQLPGFRTSGLRLQMIANFVDMLKTNAFKVRSMRVINELETWIFKKGERPDHTDGGHDDLLTCLSMGLFVMQFHVLQADKRKKRDKAMLCSWKINSNEVHYLNEGYRNSTLEHKNGLTTKRPMPFYQSKDLIKGEDNEFLRTLLLGNHKIKNTTRY